MDELDLIMVEEVAKEIVSMEPEPTLEEGFRENDPIGVGCWDIHVVRRKKVVIDQL
jgi:hypothetical protein